MTPRPPEGGVDRGGESPHFDYAQDEGELTRAEGWRNNYFILLLFLGRMADKNNYNPEDVVPPSGGGGGSMFYGASPMIFELAKKLRNNVTHTEIILWGQLKVHFPKLKFRRQHPVSNYIADFYSHTQRLIIEIDGSIHELKEVKSKDAARQKDLEDLGIKVIRFTTKEITHSLDIVLQKIEGSLAK